MLVLVILTHALVVLMDFQLNVNHINVLSCPSRLFMLLEDGFQQFIKPCCPISSLLPIKSVNAPLEWTQNISKAELATQPERLPNQLSALVSLILFV